MAYLFASREEPYKREAEKVGCLNYTPCPVCFKCMHKGVHLYDKCERCGVVICGHSEHDRSLLIKPKNFTAANTPELIADIEYEYNEYLKTKAQEA